MGRQPEHVSAEILKALAAGERSAREVTLEALEHLGGESEPVCRACRETLRAYSPGRIAERAGGTYTEVLARRVAQARDLAAEHRAANALLDELAAEEDLARAVAKVMSPRFATFGLCSVLIDHAAAVIEESPKGARHLALLAVIVARRVDRHRYRAWPTMPEDLLCASRSKLADALRATGELQEAEEELVLAERARERGSGERYYRSEVELVRCRLLIAQGQPAEARRLAARVEEWAMRPGAGREDFLWEAIRVAAEAARALDRPTEAAEELLVLAAAMRGKASWRREHRVRLELVGALTEAERFKGGWAELARLRLLSDSTESPAALARESVWEGILHAKLGRLNDAVGSLEAARRVLVEQGLGLEALRASLHLLVILADGEREAELEACLEQLPDLLRAEGLPGWAARHLVWVLEGIATSEREDRVAATVLGVVVLETLTREGGGRRPPEPVQ